MWVSGTSSLFGGIMSLGHKDLVGMLHLEGVAWAEPSSMTVLPWVYDEGGLLAHLVPCGYS